MPTYEYRCPTCKRIWDETRPAWHRNDQAICPDCGAEGKHAWTGAPHVMWFPDQTRSPFKEKLRKPE